MVELPVGDFELGMVFLGLGFGDFPGPGSTGPQFGVADWSYYHQLVVSLSVLYSTYLCYFAKCLTVKIIKINPDSCMFQNTQPIYPSLISHF